MIWQQIYAKTFLVQEVPRQKRYFDMSLYTPARKDYDAGCLESGVRDLRSKGY